MRKLQFWVILSFALGIALTTVLDSTIGQKGAMNAAMTGLVLVFAAGLEIIRLHHWMDGIQTVLGVWMVAAPFALSYDGPIAFSHVVLGMLLAIIGTAHRLVEPKPPMKP